MLRVALLRQLRCQHAVTAGAYFTHTSTELPSASLRKCAVQGCAVCCVRRVLKQNEYGALRRSYAASTELPQHCFLTVVWLDLKSVFYTRGRTRPSDVHPVAIALANGSDTYIYFRYVGAT